MKTIPTLLLFGITFFLFPISSNGVTAVNHQKFGYEIDTVKPLSDTLLEKFIPKPDFPDYQALNNMIKFTALSPIAYTNASIELSYERKLNYYYSMELSAGYLLPHMLIRKSNDWNPKIKGYQTGVMIKYFKTNRFPYLDYIGFKFNYLNNNYQEYHFKNNVKQFYTIDKQTFSFSLIGSTQILFGRFVLDIYSGIGIRYKVTEHSPQQIDVTNRGECSFINIAAYTNDAGKFWTLSLPFNIKMGYLF